MFELTSTPRNLRTIVSLELQWISVVLRGRISRITSGRCCSGRRTWVGGERMDSVEGKKWDMNHGMPPSQIAYVWDTKGNARKVWETPKCGPIRFMKFSDWKTGDFTAATATSLEQGHWFRLVSSFSLRRLLKEYGQWKNLWNSYCVWRVPTSLHTKCSLPGFLSWYFLSTLEKLVVKRPQSHRFKELAGNG